MDTSYINEEKIERLLNESKDISRERVQEIIAKSVDGKGLSLEEAACLIQIDEEGLLEEVFTAAKKVKDSIYGKRVVLFTPLYTSNECSNNCLYCGFRCGNKELCRKTLTTDEVVNEAKAIESQGHKRILLVCGEDPNKTTISHITDAIGAIYKAADIRRLNVNAAPMTVEDFRKLKDAGIGTYQIFQETYHRQTYKIMHPSGAKADYDWRLTAPERALRAGIDDLGIGPLLGLYDYKFEIMALLSHAQYLDSTYGVGPHTISVPRLRPAPGSALTKVPYPIDEWKFKKIVAVLRLSVPYTGIILSTREKPELRDELLDLGVSQISAGSSTSPGGYKERAEKGHSEQFFTDDHRSLDEMLRAICNSGYIPSFCTACYRRKRTGGDFMELAKGGEIHDYCQPNAILTFKENLLDYGSSETIKRGDIMIEKALNDISDSRMRELTIARIKELEEGKRDLYF